MKFMQSEEFNRDMRELMSGYVKKLEPEVLMKNKRVQDLVAALNGFLRNKEVVSYYYDAEAVVAEFEDEYMFAKEALKGFEKKDGEA